MPLADKSSRVGRAEGDKKVRFSSVLKTVWAAPCTLIGAVAALLLCALGASVRPVTGVLEVAFDDERHPVARLLARQPFSAITLGHIVLARTHACHRIHRKHERVHVAQYERWGPLFFVLYAASSAWQWLRGRQPYADNHFERQARIGADER